MAYGEAFKPYSPSAFEAYAQTQDLFAQAMRGDLPVAEALAQIETVANGILAQDRDGDMTDCDGHDGRRHRFCRKLYSDGPEGKVAPVCGGTKQRWHRTVRPTDRKN